MRRSTTDPTPEQDSQPESGPRAATSDDTPSDPPGPAASRVDGDDPERGGGEAGGPDESGKAAASSPSNDSLTMPLEDDTLADFDTLAPGEPVLPADEMERWQDGQQIAGRFRIQRFLGQGGMGTVYLAQDEMLGRAVALKRIPPEIIFDGDARDDLRHEANRLLDLAHENIVRIHTYYDGPTWPFIAMEMLQGPTLKRLLYQRRQQRKNTAEKQPLFSADEVRCIARQVAKGLQYAHAKGIVHRDLKPSNLMLAEPPDGELSDDDTIKITDFGISRVVADSTLRQTGKHSGTLPYMSPEQYRGEVCTPQSDLYSLGCSLYELATGAAPFRTGDIGYQVMHVTPKPPAGLPRPMGRAILRAIAKKPQQRFASVEAFLEALEGRPPQLGRLQVLSRAARVAGLLVTALVLFWALGSFLSTDRSLPKERPGRSSTSSSSATPAALRLDEAELNKYGKELRVHLDEHIPKFIGPELSGASWTAEGLAFEVPLLENTSRRGALIDTLHFEYYRDGEGFYEPTQVPVQVGDLDAGSFVTLSGLRDGDYVLNVYASPASTGNSPPRGAELFASPMRFRVDTAPPQVEIRPVAMEDFVETETDADEYRFTTFHETVRLRVTTSGADEIANASYRLIYGKERQVSTKLEEPFELNLPQSPGVTTSYDVEVEDLAGNRSAAKRLRIHRFDLGLEKFELAAPVVGNLVRLEGILRVEGDQLPVLHYLVNGEVVKEPVHHALQQSAAPLGDSGADEGERTLRRIPLTATLRLPRAANNRIDLKYVWSGGEPQAFARSLPIYNIDMRPPSIVWLNVPLNATFRTTKPDLRLEGRLAPYFEGLELLVDTQERGSTQVVLVPSGEEGEAAFSHPLELWQGTNTVSLTYRYAGQNLTPSAGEGILLTIESDQTPPSLASRIHFEPEDPWLYITVQPSEPLSQLRLQVGEDDGEAWQEVEAIPGTQLYRHITTVPEVPTRFRVEMIDLAGLRAEAGGTYPERYEVGSEAPPAVSGGTVVGDLTPTTVGERDISEPVPAVRSSARSGAVTLRAEFLREMGMDFRPFGSERYEMGVTEVSERVWYEFLRSVDPQAPAEAGRLSFPMVLAEHDPALLAKFVRWFEQQADDGYTYLIPTVQQWQAAFGGDDHPAQNLEHIRNWFGGTRPDGKRFDESPGVRYGWNQVKRIGSRKENATPTGLLDMESNVQEVVRGVDLYYVLGAHNAVRESELIERYCLRPRPFTGVPSSLSGALTGFRLCRRPAGSPDE